MKRKIRELKIAGFAFLLFALFAFGIVASAAEGTSIKVDVAVQYGQTEAREMLKRVNEFRTGSDAWFWNPDNETQTVYSAENRNMLSEYTYDYGLEKDAMLRAAEQAIYYDHTRPNGSSCFTAYTNPYGYCAENIAVGYGTEEKVFIGWQEADELYKGQGHRRSMLSPDYKYIGIGHVYYNGYHYWVQEFSSVSTDLAPTDANDELTSVSLEVALSSIDEITLISSKSGVDITYGESAEVPEIICSIHTPKAWPGKLCPVTLAGSVFDWTVTGDSDCIELDTSGKPGIITALNCGKAKVTVSALGQSCTFSVTVKPKDITDNAAVTLEGGPFSYTGNAIEPSVKVETADGTTLEEGKDYELKYSDNVDAGTAFVTVSGTGNYTGTCTAKFEIARAGLLSEDCTFADGSGKYEYTGEEIRPAVVVKHGGRTLVEDEDYELSYGKNLNVADEAAVIISGKGNYDGTISLPFEITPAELTAASCTVAEIPDQEYTGAAIKPEVSVEWNGKALSQDTDYTLAYSSNTEVGTATVTITGDGNFQGNFDTSFAIVPANIGSGTLSVDSPEYTYTGEAICPEVTVKLGDIVLEQGVDYDYTSDSYENNVNAGTAKVTVAGKGNYSGSLAGTFVIAPREISGSECTVGAVEDQTYTGAQIKPEVEVLWNGKKLLQDIDYTITYDDNINAGTANGSIAGTGNYSGAIGTVVFEILPADLSDCTLEPISEQVFTGSAVEPQITVHFGNLTLTKDVDFLAAYENNVAEGTATVVLTGTGNYTGTISGNFAIKAAPQQPPEPQAPQTPDSPEPQAPQTPDSPEPQVPQTSGPQESGTSQTPTIQQPPEASSGDQTESLAVGTVKEDSVSAASYKVKGSVSGVMTVEYVAPANKKKASVVVPNTVVIDHVPCKVTSIAPGAFKNNKKIKKVVIGKYVTSIGKNAFQGCSKLQSVKIGASVTDIKDSAFCGCSVLTSVVIPSRVTKIGKQAFYNCRKLKRITIKTKKLVLKKIGAKAFTGISSKAVIKVPGSKKKAYKTLFRKRGMSAKVKIK